MTNPTQERNHSVISGKKQADNNVIIKGRYLALFLLTFLALVCFSQEDTTRNSNVLPEDIVFNTRFDVATITDTVIVNAIELTDIDYKLKLAIDNHIKEARKKLLFPSAKKNVILVKLFDIDRSHFMWEIMEKEEVLLKHKDFEKGRFWDGYDVSVNFIGRDNEPIKTLCPYARQFHYKYKNWDIFFVSIEDIMFPYAETSKEYIFYTTHEKLVLSKNGKYDLFSEYGMELLQKGMTYKKHEWFSTQYFITDWDLLFMVTKSKYLVYTPKPL